jgi:adenine-specific DNA methylase
MDSKYIITFSISVIVLFTIGIVMLMLMVPQQSTIITTDIDEYSKIIRSKYTFEKSKNISKESLIQEYDITSQDIQSFQKYRVYQPGNSDPFTPESDLNQTAQQNNSNQQTTNSNGGTQNPPSPGK